MPNAINLVQLVGAGLKVGLGGRHSVVHITWTDVERSLLTPPSRMHIGDARCLDKFSNGQSIKQQLRNLPQSRHNNRLFAEAIALRLNIIASDRMKTPGGFGNLVFDEGTGSANSMNGLTIREIAAKADSFMSSYKDTVTGKKCIMPPGLGNMSAETLYAKIREIDNAFSGPIDTISFGGGLVLTGVRQLSQVPFLRFSTSVAPRAFSSEPPPDAFVPFQFTLNQNYPNPFNPTTTLSFVLSQPSFVTLRVYNILGQEVATLLNRDQMDLGPQEIQFNASSLSSGVYFYRIEAEGLAGEETGVSGQTYVAVKKMVLLK